MFEGLKIVELASVLAGPDVGTFFSELGAKVFKIENKNTKGDVTRKWKSKYETNDTNISAYFSSVNYNKEYLFCDFNNKSELNNVKTLIKEADIVIANFKKGSAEKFGLDYSSLKKINPKLIYGNITGYGSKSERVAYDVVLQAETGFMSINGEENSNPLKMPVALIDVLAAHQLKEGILVSLLNREKKNHGALVEVSLYDTAVSSLKNQASNWLMGQFIPTQIGSLHPNIAPYGETFLTKDEKHIVLAIGSDKQFKKMLEIINANELLNDIYATNELRIKNRGNLKNKLTPYFKKYYQEDLIKQFNKNKVPAGAVKNIKEVFENSKAKSLILEEHINGVTTKRVKTAVFKISYNS